jgi:transcriptional regulator with XRE-family HTH domain
MDSALRQKRDRVRLSLRQAARLAGIDPGQLSRVERGEGSLSVDSMVRLAAVLDVSIGWLATQLARGERRVS